MEIVNFFNSKKYHKQVNRYNKQCLNMFSRTPLTETQLDKLASSEWETTNDNGICKECNKPLIEHTKIDVDHERGYVFYESCDQTLFKIE